MENFNKQEHWEKIYSTKELQNCSWFQSRPLTSLQLIEKSGISKTAGIIDIGGGDSLLADSLLEKGYTNITVLDISEVAIHKARRRLGERANEIKWIVGDAIDFIAPEKYALWHDRAAFHFLTAPSDVACYAANAFRSLNDNGTLVVATFSESGPSKCSGIDVCRYSADELVKTFENGFKKILCLNVDHRTPSEIIQNFTFCSFVKSLVE